MTKFIVLKIGEKTIQVRDFSIDLLGECFSMNFYSNYIDWEMERRIDNLTLEVSESDGINNKKQIINFKKCFLSEYTMYFKLNEYNLCYAKCIFSSFDVKTEENPVKNKDEEEFWNKFFIIDERLYCEPTEAYIITQTYNAPDCGII